jgi:D-inositol-3-phosphate glycosyltransferase
MKVPQRILVVETQSAPGGMWHYACSLSRALSEAGCEVVLAGTAPYEPVDAGAGVRVVSLGERTVLSPFFLLTWLRRLAIQTARFRRLCILVRQFAPDIVHVHNTIGRLDFLYFRYLKRLGPRVVYTAHDPHPDTGLTRFDWARYRAADVILVHSFNGREDLQAGGIPADRIVRIHHGNYLHLCPTPALTGEDARVSLGLRPGARVALFFGTILPYKGLDVLLEAWSRLEQPVYLVVAGEPLEDFAPYRQQIARLALDAWVRLDLRYIPFEEFPKFFSAADVVVFPYRHIYQSGVLQIAYAYARPVVATSVGGLGEVVAEDRTGLVVPPEDPGALAAAIERILTVPLEAARMGARGRRLAETKYGWHAIADEVRGVYRAMRNKQQSYQPATTRRAATLADREP